MVDYHSARERYLMRSLFEDDISSSQLEGASTTCQIAKEMLSTWRQPRDRSEKMIFNNYAMMQSLRHLQDRPLSVDRILEIHRLLMREALDDPSQAGRLRTAEDNVIVQVHGDPRSEEHTSELQYLMHSSYPVFCLKKRIVPRRPHCRQEAHTSKLISLML